MSFHGVGSLILLVTSALVAQTQPQALQQPDPNRPTLFVVGDLPSAPIHDAFDPNRLKLVESLSKGQTIRTYINSGAWDQVTARFKSGDFVLIGFKPNTDASPAKLASASSSAATLTFDGAGDSTFDYMDPDTHKVEQIHNYAWYLRKLVADAIQQGVKPILSYPPTPVDPTNCCPNNPYLAYPAWIISVIATGQHIPYLNLTASGKGFRSGVEALQPDPLAPYLKRTAP